MTKIQLITYKNKGNNIVDIKIKTKTNVTYCGKQNKK